VEYLEDRYQHPYRLQWPFYAHYYAAQAFWRRGGRSWSLWQRVGIEHILQIQKVDGSWDDVSYRESRRGSHGPAYATAFSCLALSVSDGYLPLFQR